MSRFVKPPSERLPDRSLRLTFEYEGAEVRLVNVRRLEKRALPSEPILDPEARRAQSGFWYELLDAEGGPLYRRVVHSPMMFDVELHEDPAGPDPVQAHRVPVDRPRGRFSVILPDLREAASVAIFSSPLERGPSPEPARELNRFVLHDGGGPS